MSGKTIRDIPLAKASVFLYFVWYRYSCGLARDHNPVFPPSQGRLLSPSFLGRAPFQRTIRNREKSHPWNENIKQINPSPVGGKKSLHGSTVSQFFYYTVSI